MNFMAGRYEEAGSRSSPSTTSSSSSSFQQQQQHRAASGSQQPYGYGGGGGEDTTTEGGGGMLAVVVEREHMFDKVVTPSDVGKLNRLVIPKQHAEKYFPLDSAANEKGLLLNFEDRNGKPWRFRYSYWNSSQSYVMTKGWSRFVKEKKLDAGDIVSFQRGAQDSQKDRLFIDWRRRPDAPPDNPFSPHHHFSSFRPHHHHQPPNPWGPLFMHPHHHHHHQHQNPPYGPGPGGPYSTIVNGSPCPPGSIVYLRSGLQPGGSGGRGVLAPGPHQQMMMSGGGGYMDHHHQQQQQQQMTMMMNREVASESEVFESVPVVQGNKAAPKRLRLFGVNMDCPISPPHHQHISNQQQEHHDIIIDTNDQCLDDVLTLPSSVHHHHPMMMMMMPSSTTSSSSNSSLARLRHTSDDDKGKGSMSLDLDI